MGRKIKLLMGSLILLMAICSQHVYAEALQGILEEKPLEIKGYQITFPEPDAKSGFYTALPLITLKNQDKELITWYQMTFPDQRIEEGFLKVEEQKVWEDSQGDGSYQLEVQLRKKESAEEPVPGEEPLENIQVPKKGEMDDEILNAELPKWEKSFFWKVDGTGPDIQILAPLDLEAWYQPGVRVKAVVSDGGSGVGFFQGISEQQMYLAQTSESVSFVVEAMSVGNQRIPVKLEAVDQAGNYNSITFGILIDGQAPTFGIMGADPYHISSANISLQIEAAEENTFQTLEMQITRESPEGVQEQVTLPEWRKDEGKQKLEMELEQEGIYQIAMSASDQAGNTAGEKRQVIVDKSSPVICQAKWWNQKYLREFAWDYAAETPVEDFTTCRYLVKMDGQLYPSGTSVNQEGGHQIRVEAEDAAGNRAYTEFTFVIDRTEPVILCQKEVQEDGKVEVSIQTKLSEDKISKIQVNGKNRQITGGKKLYRYTFAEEGLYELVVQAKDPAGNQSEKTMRFQIRKEAGFLEEIAAPLSTAIKGEEGIEEVAVKEMKLEKRTAGVLTGIQAVIGILCGGGACALAGMILFWNRRRQE